MITRWRIRSPQFPKKAQMKWKIECGKQRRWCKRSSRYRRFSIASSKESLLFSLMKIYQNGAEIFNKTFRSEVSIGVLPLILIISSKDPCYRSVMEICQHGAKIFNKTCSFEVTIGFLPLILIVSSKESLL